MNPGHIRQLVETVLYEGYILYPYRASSKKNRSRFTFGRVYPRDYSEAENGAESCLMQAQCLLRPESAEWTAQVDLRFLHPLARDTETDGQRPESWQESVERSVAVELGPDRPAAISTFSFPASCTAEPLRDAAGRAVGRMIRRQEAVSGRIEVFAEPAGAGVLRLTARIANLTPADATVLAEAGEVILRTFASTHALFTARGAAFVSLTDPPAELGAAAAECRNIGVWPVLVGEEARGERDAMLASPIILSDYPKIAPESAGSLFDGTEIDEILTLRILTMTDEEKREMRDLDPRTREILERTEALPPERLMGMHGAMRDPPPFDEVIFGANARLEFVESAGALLRAGDRVRIRPRARADAMDMMLEGKSALIEAIEQDAEGRVHLALVVEDDPGRELGFMRQTGHRFFYGLDEVQPLAGEGKQP